MVGYAGERVDATREVGVRLDFACTECGFASTVLAIGRGQGSAHNPFFLETGADERAADESYFAAHRSAREAARLVRCPRCGERDAAGARSFWIWALLKMFCLAAVAGLAAGILFLADAAAIGWVFMAVGPLAAATAIYLLDIRPRWDTIEARICFDPPRLKHRRPREPTAAAYFNLDRPN